METQNNLDLNNPEPVPVKNDQAAVWDLVIADMQARDASGLAKYGTRLQPFSGRRSLVDLYQELLDAVVYARQRIEEDARGMPDALNRFASLCHARSVAAGWYTDRSTGCALTRNVGEMLALIHSEISEALEGYRKGLQDDHLPHRRMIEVELADAMIRIGDLAGYLNLDLGGAISEKLEYNRNRADHKLENRKKEGGKAF